MAADVPLSEGDVNVSPARAAWRAGLSDQARAALDEDAWRPGERVPPERELAAVASWRAKLPPPRTKPARGLR